MRSSKYETRRVNDLQEPRPRLEITRKSSSCQGATHGGGGGGFSAKFRLEGGRPQFQNVTVGSTNFCENDTLARLIFHSEVL